MLTMPTPSRPKKAAAYATRCCWLSTPWRRSATLARAWSGESFANFSPDNPRFSYAFLAIPVPWAASPILLTNRSRFLSMAWVEIPERSAAYLSSCSCPIPSPILSAVLAARSPRPAVESAILKIPPATAAPAIEALRPRVAISRPNPPAFAASPEPMILDHPFARRCARSI